MQITLFACPSIHTFYHSTEFRVSTCRRFLERLTICIFVLAWPIDSPCYLGKRIDNTKQQARDKTHICTYTHTNTHTHRLQHLNGIPGRPRAQTLAPSMPAITSWTHKHIERGVGSSMGPTIQIRGSRRKRSLVYTHLLPDSELC